MKLSPAMMRMLRAIRDHGDHLHGLVGRSAHGGADATKWALHGRGLIILMAGVPVLSDAGLAVVGPREDES